MNKFRAEVQLLQRAMSEGAISQDQFSARVKLAADRYKTAAAGFSTASNQMRFGAQNLGFQLQDVAVQFAGGAGAARIFAQQGPQIVQAVQMMSGTTGRFAAFMGGPWGVAIGVGVAVLGALVSKLFETDDATSKAEKSTRSFTEVLRDSASSWEEVRKAAKDYADQQQKNRAVTLDTITAEASAIAARIKSAIAVRQQLQAELELQKQRLAFRFSDVGGIVGNIGAVALNPVEQKIKDNAAALEQLQRSAGEVTIKMADAIATLNSNPEAKIKAGFDILRDSARKTIKDIDALTARLTALNKQEAAALKALQDAGKQHGSGLFGRQVSASEAKSIAQAAGLQVNSSTRSFSEQKALYDRWVAQGRPSDNPVAMPGSSAHEGVKGRWALDIQFGKGITPELLKKVFADQGVSLSKIIKERGHFHIEGSTGQADTAARDAERAREEQARNAKDLADETSNLNSQLLEATRANVNDEAELARLARERVNVEADKLKADIEAKAVLNPLVAAHKDELDAVVEQVRQQKLLTINTAEQARILQEASDRRNDAHQTAIEMLNLEEDLATTTAERRRIALEILEHEKDQARTQAQTTLDLFAIGKATAEQARRAQDTLNNLDQLYSLKGQSAINATRGPLEQYLADMDPSKIGDRVQSAVVDELESVRKGIDDAISGALGIEDPFLRSLIDMFIEQVLIRPIAQALQNSMGGGGLFGSIFGALGGIFGGGGGGGPAAFVGHSLGAFATGTNFAPGGLALVGERGPELVNLPRGSQVIPNHALKSLANDNGTTVNLYMQASGNPRADRESAQQAATVLRRQLSPMRVM